MRALLAIALVSSALAWAQDRPAGIEEALQRGPQDFLEQAVVGPQDDGTYVVATTQAVDPAGQTILFPGRPVDLAVSPDGRTLAVKNRTDVVFIDMATKQIRQTLPFPRGGATFIGIAWSRDGGKVWVTDTKSWLRSAAPNDKGEYAWADEIRLPGPEGEAEPNAAAGGFVLDEDAGLAYVTLSRNNTLGVVNLASKTVEAQIPVGIAPYTVRVRDGKAYVSNWGGRRPTEGDTTGLTSGSPIVVDPETGVPSTGSVSIIEPRRAGTVDRRDRGGAPSLRLGPVSRRFTRLYVANANSDTLSVIDTAADTRWRTPLGAKPMAELPFGSAPNALDLLPRRIATLYVALGGNNAARGHRPWPRRSVKGLIPTGWYPGAVVYIPGDGDEPAALCVANTKGVGSRFKTPNAQPASKRESWRTDVHGYELPRPHGLAHLRRTCPATTPWREYTTARRRQHAPAPDAQR
jgi:YVTN family beta-propeller protein